MLTGSQDFSRQINRLHVLNAVRRRELISRTELASQLGLAQGTVSAIVGGLVAEGFLFERGTKTGDAVGGRPRMRLELNPDIAHVVGAYVSPIGEVSAEVANLRGDKLSRTTERFSLEGGDGDAFVDALSAAVGRAVLESGLSI